MKYFVYAAFKEADKEAMVDSAVCTIYQNGSNSVDAGTMTKISNGLFFYEFNYEQAGTYLARCVGSRTGKDTLLFTHIFEIVEDLRPHYINIEPIENILNQIKTKLGTNYDESLESYLNELTSYSTGTTPLPGMIPVTALNCTFAEIPGDNSMIIDGTGQGITGAKVSFYPQMDLTKEPYVTHTNFGYWGVYVPAGNYLVRIQTGGSSIDLIKEVLP